MPKTSAPLGKDNPLSVTSSYRAVSGSVTAGTWGRPATLILARAAYAGAWAALTALPRVRTAMLAGWLAGLLTRAGDLLFAANDREARWRGWDIQRRHAGLSRCYRDPRFGTLIRCSRCRGTGTTAASSPCGHCSGDGRISLDQPPLTHDG